MSSVRPGALEVSTSVVETDGRRVALVRAAGDVDLRNAAELGSVLGSDACTSADAVALDLTAVPFMDSSGLRTILVALESLRLALVLQPGSPIAHLLELTNVADRIPTFATEEAAFAGLTGVEEDA